MHPIPAAGAGQAGEDGGRSPAFFFADEEVVLPSQHDPLHFALANVVVDGHRRLAREHCQLSQLPQDVARRLGNRVLGEQPQLPVREFVVQGVEPRLGLLPAEGEAGGGIQGLCFTLGLR